MSSLSGGLLGQIALHYKLVTPDQLAQAVKTQGRFVNPKRLGEILLELGFINREQLDWLLRAQEQVAARQRDAAQKEQQRAQAAVRKDPRAEPEVIEAPVAEERRAPAEQRAGAGISVPPPTRAGEHAIDRVLAQAVKLRASDVHFHTGAPIQMRIHGRLMPVKAPPPSREEMERNLTELLKPDQAALLEQRGELDLAYTIPGIARFRGNVYRQQRGLDAVFRPIPTELPTLDSLGLPRMLTRLTTYHQGLVLITGPAGCGKSSTLAALINLINEERTDHIITVEDPIEFLHPSKSCVVNQRQVVRHTESFASALRAALREDPDVIAIGELRDLETVSLAITAAETGHLVLATLHTNNSIRTISRILDVFPPKQQPQIRSMVSESLRAVISQRLVPTIDGTRRVAAVEVLLTTTAISNLIREEKSFQIKSILQTGRAQGMCLLDDSLAELVKTGVVAKEVARRFCEDPKLFA